MVAAERAKKPQIQPQAIENTKRRMEAGVGIEPAYTDLQKSTDENQQKKP
jgi:hypothetical protein